MNATALIRMRQWMLAGTCVALLAHPRPGGAQPSQYVMKAGDDLLSIAEAIRPKEASLNQMGLALVKANQRLIYERTSIRLQPGTVLTVPDKATVMKTDAATAAREFGRMWRAEQHFRAAVALEKSRDMFYAFVSYVQAARMGHGLAQYRLGQLYDRDFTGFVTHDLLASAQWYQKARASEVNLPKMRPRY